MPSSLHRWVTMAGTRIRFGIVIAPILSGSKNFMVIACLLTLSSIFNSSAAGGQNGAKFGARPADDVRRGVPVDAGVGHRHAMTEQREVLRNGLTARGEVALEHETDDRTVAFPDLVRTVGHYQRLQGVILERVGVRAVGDDVVRQLR